MIIENIETELKNKPYFEWHDSLNNCGLISRHIKEDIEKDMPDINIVNIIQGTVTDSCNDSTHHMFVHIPESECGYKSGLVIDGTIDQFTQENKENVSNINSAFSKRANKNFVVCKLSESPYNHALN